MIVINIIRLGWKGVMEVQNTYILHYNIKITIRISRVNLDINQVAYRLTFLSERDIAVVRAFAHSVMGCWIDPSWCTH